METNKEIPTADAFLCEKLPDNFFKGWYNGTLIDPEEARIFMIEFTKLHLSKQAEVIAEKALVKTIIVDLDPYTTVDKQSIINASEEYIKNVK